MSDFEIANFFFGIQNQEDNENGTRNVQDHEQIV